MTLQMSKCLYIDDVFAGKVGSDVKLGLEY